jgi:benzoyl-CoA reductase subunit C
VHVTNNISGDGGSKTGIKNGTGLTKGDRQMADGLFDQFKNWYEKRHDYARDWKARTGGQVVATMCTYTAEELLIAANMLPVRVLGAHEPQNVTEPHIFGMFCPFCRDSLA